MPPKPLHYPRKRYDPSLPLPPGQHSRRMLQPRYAVGHCLTLEDVFHQNVDYALLANTDGSNTTKHHKVRDKRQLAKQIFWEFLTTLLDDMIATGNQYLFPVVPLGRFRIVAMPEKPANYKAKRGRYPMFDLARDDFRLYELRFEYCQFNNPKVYQRCCRMDLPRYYRLAELVNKELVSYDLN